MKIVATLKPDAPEVPAVLTESFVCLVPGMGAWDEQKLVMMKPGTQVEGSSLNVSGDHWVLGENPFQERAKFRKEDFPSKFNVEFINE